MKQLVVLGVVAALIAGIVYVLRAPAPEQTQIALTPAMDAGEDRPAGILPESGALAERTVLDITVHTIEELEVLFDRAEQLASRPRPAGAEASIVLVLHGPEVEFFSIRNYDQYKDVVDRAARLDAFDVVDVKICQTMMDRQGITADDIPSFIEQVPYGPAEVERLLREGYVYF